jgi:hypothetical protein
MACDTGLLGSGVEVGTNTRYAPLARLSAHYQQQATLKPLETKTMVMKTGRYTPVSRLQQVWLSILAGCGYLVEINSALRAEQALVEVWHLDHCADPSMLSRTLDRLTQMNIEQLRTAETTMGRNHSRTIDHDWRGYLRPRIIRFASRVQGRAAPQATSVVKKHHRTPVSMGQQCLTWGNELVGCGGGDRKCFSVNFSPLPARRVAE